MTPSLWSEKISRLLSHHHSQVGQNCSLLRHLDICSSGAVTEQGTSWLLLCQHLEELNLFQVIEKGSPDTDLTVNFRPLNRYLDMRSLYKVCPGKTQFMYLVILQLVQAPFCGPMRCHGSSYGIHCQAQEWSSHFDSC